MRVSNEAKIFTAVVAVGLLYLLWRKKGGSTPASVNTQAGQETAAIIAAPVNVISRAGVCSPVPQIFAS